MMLLPSEPRMGWNGSVTSVPLGGSSGVHMMVLGLSLAGATVCVTAGAADAVEAAPEADAWALETTELTLTAGADDGRSAAELVAAEDGTLEATWLTAGAETAMVARASRARKVRGRRNIFS